MKTQFPSFKNFIEHSKNKDLPLDVFVQIDGTLWSHNRGLVLVKLLHPKEVSPLQEYDNKIIEVDSLHYLVSLHYSYYRTYFWISVEKI